MLTTKSEDLLRILAKHGEMSAQELLKNVHRSRGDYLDFYPVAALLHGNYIATDSSGERSGQQFQDKLGLNTQETAVFLCQLMLPQGESFQFNNCGRESAAKFPLKMFMTADGYLRLDELDQRRIERNRKRIDYFVSFTVAVIVALLSSYLTHYFASRRLQIERNQRVVTSSSPSPAP